MSLTANTRRSDKKLDKRQRIRDAASALFRERGFEATTTRAIAERAGIAAGTLFLYVRDKDDALALVYQDDVRAMLTDRLATLPSRARFARRLLHVFRGFFELYAEHPELSRRFVQRIPTLDRELRSSHEELNDAILRAISAELERGVERGELSLGSSREVATTTLFAIFRVHVFQWLSLPPCDVERGVGDLEAAVKQLVHGIGARS